MSEATDTFKHMDVVVSAMILRLMEKLYPDSKRNQLIGRFWRKQPNGKSAFTLTSNSDIKVISLEDTILLKTNTIDLSKNPYLDREYFDTLDDEVEIRNITGRYKEVWKAQYGKCYYCKQPIKDYQDKVIIIKDLSKENNFRNMAYIHKECELAELQFINSEGDTDGKSIYELIDDIENFENQEKEKKKKYKFEKLKEFFKETKKRKFVLKFSDIEKISGEKLCKSAHKYKSYFYNNQDSGSICNSWISQGYKITKIDMEKKKIYFEKGK